MEMIPLVLVRHGVLSALRDWKRSAWLVIGVMLGIAFYITVSTIGASYTALVELPFSRIESDLIIQLGSKGKRQASGQAGSIRLPFSNRPIHMELIDSIASLEGIKQLSPAVLLWHQKNRTFVTLAGIHSHSATGGPAKVMQWISKGRAIKESGETVVESHYARFHKLAPGSTVRFRERDFKVVGIAKIKEGASLAAANFYISIGDARELADMADGSANLLSVTLNRGVQKESIQKEIGLLLPEAIVSSSDSIGDMMQGFARISSKASLLLTITALVFTLLLAGLLIIGRQQEQRWQIGLMQTLGWRKKDIVLSYGLEALILTLAGTLAGVGLSLLLVLGIGTFEVSLALPWNLSPTPMGVHHGGAGRVMQVGLPIRLQPVTMVFGMVITCLVAVITSLLAAARQASREVRQTLFEQ